MTLGKVFSEEKYPKVKMEWVLAMVLIVLVFLSGLDSSVYWFLT